MMEQTDKLFNALLRMMIARIQAALDEEDPEKSRELMQAMLKDLQRTLED